MTWWKPSPLPLPIFLSIRGHRPATRSLEAPVALLGRREVPDPDRDQPTTGSADRVTSP